MKVWWIMLLLAQVPVRTLLSYPNSWAGNHRSPVWADHILHRPNLSPRRHRYRNRRPPFVEYYLPDVMRINQANRPFTTVSSRNQLLMDQTAFFHKMLKNVDYECFNEQEATAPSVASKESLKQKRKKIKNFTNKSSFSWRNSKQMFDNVTSNASQTTQVPRHSSHPVEVISEKQMLDIILFISSLFLLLNVILILGKCGCYRGRRKGDSFSSKGSYMSMCTLCNHSRDNVRCLSCCCATIADPCDIYCCEKCELHCKAHCTHQSSRRTFLSRLVGISKKVCCLLGRQSRTTPSLYQHTYATAPPLLPRQPSSTSIIKISEPENRRKASFISEASVMRNPEAPPLYSEAYPPIMSDSLPQCTCYDDRKDVEEKIKNLLKSAAKESSRGRIAAEMALINVVNQITKFQSIRGRNEEELEKEKRRIYSLVQKALKDIRNFKSCDVWGEDTIVDQTIHKIMNVCCCNLVNHSPKNLQFLLDLLYKAAYDFSHQSGNTEGILDSTVDEIIKRRLIQEVPTDFSDPATIDAPPEVRLRTYLKYQVAIILCAEAHQKEYVINKVYHNILRTNPRNPEVFQQHHIPVEDPSPPVEIDHLGAKWLHLTAQEPQDESCHFSKESPDVELPKRLLQKLRRPK